MLYRGSGDVSPSSLWLDGLDDLYDSKYSAMTMYGYASYGEEIKRTLEPGDVAGVQAVYAQWRQ